MGDVIGEGRAVDLGELRAVAELLREAAASCGDWSGGWGEEALCAICYVASARIRAAIGEEEGL